MYDSISFLGGYTLPLGYLTPWDTLPHFPGTTKAGGTHLPECFLVKICIPMDHENWRFSTLNFESIFCVIENIVTVVKWQRTFLGH